MAEQEKSFRCIVYATGQDSKSKIFVAFNGRQMFIPQGEEVVLPECLINVLREAIERVPGKPGLEASASPRFVVDVRGENERPQNITDVKGKLPKSQPTEGE